MSRQHQCTEDQFLKDVAYHSMTIIRDEGVHRHIRFKRQGNSAYWFDLITWEGTLCIDGDMGTYVFRRLHDMFEFFRTDREYLKRQGNQLAINPSYWSEKLRAPDSRHAEEYSPGSFRQHVKEAYAQWLESHKPDEDEDQSTQSEFAEQAAQIWQEIEDEVLCCAEDGDVRAYDAARDFQSIVPGVSFDMADCWEWRCREYKFHFIWCCYAIAWGIQQYDTSTARTADEVQA